MEKARLIGLGFVGDSVSCGALGAYFARKGNTGGEVEGMGGVMVCRTGHSVTRLIVVLLYTLRHGRSLRDICLTDELSKGLKNLRSVQEYVFDVFLSNLLKRFRRLLIIVSRTDIRECCANSHTSYLDITLKALNLVGVVHIAVPCLLLDETLASRS